MEDGLEALSTSPTHMRRCCENKSPINLHTIVSDQDDLETIYFQCLTRCYKSFLGLHQIHRITPYSLGTAAESVLQFQVL